MARLGTLAITFIALIFMSSAGSPLLAQAAVEYGGAQTRSTIHVTGTGKIEAVPDRATASAGVVSDGETAAAALRNNSAKMAKVINSLKQAGVEAKDIGTSGLNLQPIYEHRKSSNRNEPPLIVGYRVSNQITVLFRDLDTMGAKLDALVSSGANQLNGVGFFVSDADKRLDAARAEAMKDALRKAKIYAQAVGTTLGAPITIREGGGGIRPPRPQMRAMAMESMAADVPIEAGSQKLSISVSVIFEIKE